jgi:hypothetical protein
MANEPHPYLKRVSVVLTYADNTMETVLIEGKQMMGAVTLASHHMHDIECTTDVIDDAIRVAIEPYHIAIAIGNVERITRYGLCFCGNPKHIVAHVEGVEG